MSGVGGMDNYHPGEMDRIAILRAAVQLSTAAELPFGI
jgi:hypothetical protein